MPTPQLSPSGIVLAFLVTWWLLASAIARSFDAIRAVRSFLRGE